MLPSCRLAFRSGPSILVTAILTVAACGGSLSKADEVTVYRIQNRWNQFIFDVGTKVGYHKAGDDAKHRWVLEETPKGQRIKNLATGAYLAATKDAPEVKLIPPAGPGDLDTTSLWTMDVVSGSWLSIKSCTTGKYLTCEAQRGVVDCDGTDVPTSQTWWLSQWEFVHVGGPKPPKRYRLHEIAVSSPDYCSDVAGNTTVTLVAPGFKHVIVKCWKQGDGLGSDSTVATVDLDAKGNGSFVFPANSYPQGPVTVRISGENDAANQVWNVAPFETISAFSYGDPGEELKPVTIHAARNRVFSGRLAVSSDQAINGLKVTVSDLKQSGGQGALPASAVRVRYAELAVPRKSWVPPHRFDALLDTVPAQVAVIQVPPPRGASITPVTGAVASLWFTVRTPADAEPGLYEGTVTVEAEGLTPTKTPLRVKVSRWTMPDPKQFRQHQLICVSPDSVARHYQVPLWSDRHFELMAKSLSLLAEINSRRIPVNLAIDFYGEQSNRETMVRWIQQLDGSFTYDFSLFDRYLDLVAKHCGKPFPLRLNCWGEPDRGRKPAVKVSLLDPATGKVEPMPQPLLGSEQSYQFWKPVIDQALKKLEARGWLDVTAFGHNSYCYSPKPEIVDVANKLWPEGRWAYSAHNGALGKSFAGTQKSVAMPVTWSLVVWNEGP